MKVLIIGATGQVGRHTVEHVLLAGHSVTAFGRSAAEQDWPDGVTPFAGDATTQSDVDEAIKGHDAVISTYGAPLNKETILHVPTIMQDGTRKILSAMEKYGVQRFVCMTAIGAGDSEGHGRFIFRNVIEPVLLGRIMEDRTKQEELVRASGLDEWIIVRPTELSDADPGPVRVIEEIEAEEEPTTIPRSDVGRFLVQQLQDERFLKKTILITRDESGAA